MTAGGEGSACIGRKLSPEHKAKVVAALRANAPTKEQSAMYSARRRGEKRSEIGRNNISEGMRAARAAGLTVAQKAQLEKVHERNTGTIRSEATRLKISSALKGKAKTLKLTEEQIREMLSLKLPRIDLAKMYGIDVGTVTKYRQRIQIIKPEIHALA